MVIQSMIHIALACVLLTPTMAMAQAGHWEGKIEIPDRPLGITVDLARNAAGAWTGSMTVLTSTSVDVPLSGLTVENTKVRFTSTLPQKVEFEGTVSADGASLSGNASTKAGAVPFQLKRTGEADVKVPPASSKLSREFAGAWESATQVDGKVKHVGMRLTAAPDGTAIGTIIAIDQGNLEIPVSTVTVNGRELQWESRSIGTTYRGTLGDNGEIAGELVQGPAKFAVVFKRK
jgi:hypothetical protein